MGLFPTFVKRNSKSEIDDYWYHPISPPTTSGVKVDEATSIKYLTVFSCVSLISGDIGSLPLILYRRLPNGGKERILDHPLYDILHTAPNEETTSYQWRETGVTHNLLWGNHYSIIERSVQGKVVALYQIADPSKVTVERNGAGNIIYRVKKNQGKEVIYQKGDIFHVPGMSFNGLIGLSMIQNAREAIGLGMAAEEFGSRFFGQGTHPSGVVEMDGVLGESRDEYVKRFREGYRGLGKSHSVMILEGGSKYKPITMPLKDAQFLEARDHQKVEICGMYHVPPHKIALHGANSNYNNLEQENQHYVDTCLRQWAIRWESSIGQQLLSKTERKSGLFAEFLFEGLLRGDSASRGEFYNKMWNMGLMSINEIRAKENMNPITEGDQHFVPLNMVPLDQSRKMLETPIPVEPVEDEEIEEDALPLQIEFRSIRTRDQLSKQYYPLFESAAERIVNREGNAVKKQVKKQLGDRAKSSMEKWLNEFYAGMDSTIRREIGPVFRSFSEAILKESIDEIGVDPDKADMDVFIEKYIDRYVERHIESSQGQLVSLLDKELTELEIRVDEWAEKRPQKIASNETVRNANAVYQAVAFAVGLSTIWHIRGTQTCPYCRELKGKKVKSGQSFVSAGDELDPEGGTGPMRIFGITTHPPLHQGCDCYLGAG